VIAGGLVAAVNSAAPFAHGSWLAAYLVLVAGVAQITLGVAAAALAPADRSARLAPAQLLLWNVGSLAVPAGVLVTQRVLVALGSIALLAALAACASPHALTSFAAVEEDGRITYPQADHSEQPS
jgi:hypothetical protein